MYKVRLWAYFSWATWWCFSVICGLYRPDCGLQRIDHIVGNQPDLDMNNIVNWFVPSMLSYYATHLARGLVTLIFTRESL